VCVPIVFVSQVSIPYETQHFILLSLFINVKDYSIPICAEFVDFVMAYHTTKFLISRDKVHPLAEHSE
jgi:hypothetical protein